MFGRSSFSWYSSRIAALRSSRRIPLSVPSEPIKRLMAVFLARETMFSIIAPLTKSLKKRVSRSPRAYVTSINRFSSVVAYMSFAASLMKCFAIASVSPLNCWRVSSENGISGVRYIAKMSLAPSRLGRSILIFTSSRPGLRTAGSRRSCRLLAPMTMTSRRFSTPSISERNCGTSVDSISDEIPMPLDRNRESISSKKMITGNPSRDLSRAFWKTSRILRSVSPTYLFKSSGPLMLMK